MNSNYILAGCIGFLVGGTSCGVAAHIFTKRKYKKILDETVDRYEKRLGDSSHLADVPEQYRRKSRIVSLSKINKEVNDENYTETQSFSDEEKELIKEKLRYNNEQTINYASKYKVSVQDIIDEQAEAENEEEPEEELEKETLNNGHVNVLEAVKEAERNLGRTPVIISEEDFIDICDNSPDTWDSCNLYLYNDGVIADEEDTTYEADEIQKMLGDCIDKYDFRNSKEKVIYIKSFELNTVYEIVKKNKPFVK